MMKKVILASASPRRKELLSVAGVEFDICISNADETVPTGTEPAAAVKMIASKKACAVAQEHPEAVVIGADTVVVCCGKILGKPRDAENAADMLAMLSGKEHQVITGVCIVSGESKKVFHKVSTVKFYDLTAEEIRAYVETGEPMDKAGAYGIQGKGCTLVERIEGDYFNIVGLPVAAVLRELKNF